MSDSLIRECNLAFVKEEMYYYIFLYINCTPALKSAGEKWSAHCAKKRVPMSPENWGRGPTALALGATEINPATAPSFPLYSLLQMSKPLGSFPLQLHTRSGQCMGLQSQLIAPPLSPCASMPYQPCHISPKVSVLDQALAHGPQALDTLDL